MNIGTKDQGENTSNIIKIHLPIMTTRRRITRSNSDSVTNKSNDAGEDENVPRDTDVLFGNYNFLESHDGTKQWASVVGSYSQQYYWSSDLYQKIRNDKRLIGKRYFMLIKKGKFRPATGLEIEQRTCGVFDNGGGKKKQSRKRRTSTGDVSTTGAEIATKSEGRHFQEGDNVYVYDQLWRAKIVEVGDFLDGVKFKVHYMGFLATSDQWVDRLQIFPHSEKMKEIYHQIDKAEGTAFQGEYDVVQTNGNGADEEEEHDAGAKKRRKTQTNGETGAASRNDSNEAAPAPTAATKPRSSRSASNTSTAAVSEDSISASDYNNVTKLASDGASEIISHRLFSIKQKPKTTDATTTTARSAATTIAVTTSTTASINCNSTLDLSQVITDALEKCKVAKQKAQELGMTAIVPLLNAEGANWSLGVIHQYLNVKEIQTNLPALDQMQSNVDKWKKEGGIKGLEAMAMERNIQKWNKAQEHLARFVECLVEDL